MLLLENGWVAPTQRTIPRFSLERPDTVAQAVEAWGAGGPQAIYGHGCTDLVAQFREGLPVSTLVSLSRVASLRTAERDDGDLVIGAGVDHHEGSRHGTVVSALPGLAKAWGSIATRRIRIRATIGGNLMARRARYEMSIMLDALDASVVFATPRGTAQLQPHEVWTRNPQPGALLTSVRIPEVNAVRFAYDRSMRPLLTVAVAVRGDRVRLAVGSEYHRPASAESDLGGMPLHNTDPHELGRSLAELLPGWIGDPAASTSYRRWVAGVLTGRVLSELATQETS